MELDFVNLKKIQTGRSNTAHWKYKSWFQFLETGYLEVSRM